MIANSAYLSVDMNSNVISVDATDLDWVHILEIVGFLAINMQLH